METKLRAVFTAGLECVRVTDVCAELGISRQSYYKYLRRFREEGPAGLVERSRAPNRSPQAISVELEDEIVRLRKASDVDNGAQMIAYQLARAGWAVPAVSTIHRVLVNRGLVTPQPQKRPKSATKRFVWPRPNDAWQIDATCWALADGKTVWIMDILDDHSRVLVAAQACDGPTAAAAWDAVCAGAARWGLPAHVMSDNGTCFTSRLAAASGEARETLFDRDLRALGIRHICSTPGHPQTCGKLERFHQTLKRWLATQPPASSLTRLQRQLDTWAEHYNNNRPHRALRGATPAEAWHATDRARPGPPIPGVTEAAVKTVASNGCVFHRNAIINIGVALRGQQVLIIARGDDLAIFGEPGLIRRLTINPRTRYYPRSGIIGPCN